MIGLLLLSVLPSAVLLLVNGVYSPFLSGWLILHGNPQRPSIRSTSLRWFGMETLGSERKRAGHILGTVRFPLIFTFISRRIIIPEGWKLCHLSMFVGKSPVDFAPCTLFPLLKISFRFVELFTAILSLRTLCPQPSTQPRVIFAQPELSLPLPCHRARDESQTKRQNRRAQRSCARRNFPRPIGLQSDAGTHSRVPPSPSLLDNLNTLTFVGND